MNRKEFAKYQSKDIWYSRKYLTEESQRAAAKAAGITWKEAKEWKSYWLGVLYESTPTFTIFDLNVTSEELSELFVGKYNKESYMNLLTTRIPNIPYKPWRIAMEHIISLCLLRGDYESKNKYDAMIPNDTLKTFSRACDLRP